PAEEPKKALLPPVVLVLPAEEPKKALLALVVLVPALMPTNKFCDPAALNTCCPLRLKRVVALRKLADKVPPAVPSPLMLKFPPACCAVPFCRKPLAAKPPSCAALMAYGVEVIGWRGLSVVKEPPPFGLTAISRNRAEPSKQVGQAPKSSGTLK